MESRPRLVDIEVQVSHGHWSVCGQTLKWWYDVPVSASSSAGLEDVKKYTIEIRRPGGSLRIATGRGC